MAVVEELPKTHHVYCLGYEGVWRAKIPDQLDKLNNHKLKFEPKCIFSCDPNLLPPRMGLVSSGDNVYMVGAKDDHPILYVLDPTSFQEECPLKDPKLLSKPLKLPPTATKPLLFPLMIHANHNIYFLTQYVSPWFDKSIDHICLQSFDPTNNRLQILDPPPFKPDDGDTFRVTAHLAVLESIYLFVQGKLQADRTNQFTFMRVFSFNTTSLKWKEHKKTMPRFKKKAIPIPFLHRGDTGVSQEFDDASFFLVALNHFIPTAYRVTRTKSGSIKPLSFRSLKEIKSRDRTRMVHLHDMGSGKFCTMYESLHVPLKIYVCKIDFDKEYAIQCSGQVSPLTKSAEILCSMKLLNDDPSIGYPLFYAYCLASAPAPASRSSGNQIAAPEEQDMDGKRDRETRKRKRNTRTHRKVRNREVKH